jgi:hypothetical protein
VIYKFHKATICFGNVLLPPMLCFTCVYDMLILPALGANAHICAQVASDTSLTARASEEDGRSRKLKCLKCLRCAESA